MNGVFVPFCLSLLFCWTFQVLSKCPLASITPFYDFLVVLWHKGIFFISLVCFHFVILKNTNRNSKQISKINEKKMEYDRANF